MIRRAVPAIGYQRVPSDAAAICDELRVAWVERAARPGRGEPAASLGGRRVLPLESRRSPELALLVMIATKMGFLVKELAEQCEALLHNKRCLESTTRDGRRE